MEVGRPTDMTDEVLAEIEEGIINGKTIKDLAQQTGISDSTLYDWTYKNYGNFADKLKTWKLMAKLKKAESRADEILALPLQDTEGKIDPAVLRTVQKESEFIRETLAKDTYSKRNELTGKDGTEFKVNIINYGANNTVQLPAEGVPTTAPPSNG